MNARAFTLIEILIAMALSAMVLVFVVVFVGDVSQYNLFINDRLQSQRELEQTLRTIVSEIRSIGPAQNGSYPIAAATDTALTFYMDVDNNGQFDQVRYFLSGTTLKRGVTAPVGQPAAYPPANEQVRDVVNHVVTGTPIFRYFPTDASSTANPLAQPVTVSDIRMIKVFVTVDIDPSRPPGPVSLTVTGTIRNLRGEI